MGKDDKIGVLSAFSRRATKSMTLGGVMKRRFFRVSQAGASFHDQWRTNNLGVICI